MLSSAIAIFVSLIVVAFPILVFYVVQANFERIGSKEFDLTLGAMIEMTRIDKMSLTC